MSQCLISQAGSATTFQKLEKYYGKGLNALLVRQVVQQLLQKQQKKQNRLNALLVRQVVQPGFSKEELTQMGLNALLVRQVVQPY